MAHVAEQRVGRHAGLTAVDADLTALDHATSAAIELLGEPGIGKTRLLAELAHRADLQGLTLVRGGRRAKYLALLARSRLANAQREDAERTVAQADAVAAFTELRMAQAWISRRDLRKLGRVVSRRSKPGAAAGPGAGITSLTGRELELARLVVDRKTNPEIAATLFLSQKAVEAHLTNIFRKMRVSTRVELARAVEHAERP
jgi:DNA-binding CsgD family transcriptional regulator